MSITKNEIKIAIIGAGWSGIGCARMLAQAGYKFDIFETLSDVGGVWHPQNHYSGLAIHSYARNVEYYDFPLPSHINRADRITAQQVYDYLRSYCEFHGLYNFMTFNKYAKQVSYDSKSNKYELTLEDVNDASSSVTNEYTHVIYTHGFCSHTIPHFDGLDKFSGQAIHSFQATEEVIQSLVKDNKRVTIIGGSKTSTDLILQFQKRAYNVSWLYRKNYWFINRDVMHNVLDDNLTNRIKMFFTKLIYKVSDKCASIHPEAAFYYMRAFNLIHTFGKKHSDFKRFHNGALDSNQIKLLRQYNQTNHVPGDIKCFDESGIVLKDGTKVQSDCIIFCTGSGPCESFINIQKDEKQFDISSVKDVYRSRVIPDLPGIIFTSFSPFATGVVNGLCYGNWIISYVESNFGVEYLRKHSTKYKEPFFRKHLLFDSSDYIIRIGMQMLEPFFTSGELSGDSFEKWHIKNTFSTQPAKPLTFHKPKFD